MKVINIVRNILFAIAVVVLLSAGLCFMLQLKPAVVMSGSMEPTFHMGSVVIVDKKTSDSVKVGDPIAFHVSDAYVTHRIVEETEQGFITKGDANDTTDPWEIDPSKVDGKVVLNVPIIGYAFKFISSKRGLLIVGSFLICLLLTGLMDSTPKRYRPKHVKGKF